jgi:hypothetical protein
MTANVYSNYFEKLITLNYCNNKYKYVAKVDCSGKRLMVCWKI